MRKMTAIKNLGFASIDQPSVNYDWSEGCGERWDFHEASECQKCGKVLLNVRGEEEHQYLDDDSECDGYVYSADGPMMNYFYPIGGPGYRGGIDTEEIQKALIGLPLCLVEFHDHEDDYQYALALTGGGMDLSWQIAEAFMRIGHLPPAWIELAHFAGMKPTKRNRWILAGCRASARAMIHRYQGMLRNHKRTSQWMDSQKK